MFDINLPNLSTNEYRGHAFPAHLCITTLLVVACYGTIHGLEA